MALGSQAEPSRAVSDADLLIAKRVVDYYNHLKGKGVFEPTLSSCTVAFQQALTKTSGDPVTLVVRQEDAAA